MIENDKNLYFNASDIVYLSTVNASKEDQDKFNSVIAELNYDYPKSENE